MSPTDNGLWQDDEYKERAARLLTDNSKKILELLSMYIQATGTWCVTLDGFFYERG